MSGDGTDPSSAEEPWLGTWPLVGREREVAAVADLLASTDHVGLVLAGPAGVGKTRLAYECERLARERGFRVSRVTASRSASTTPMGALAPLLPARTERVEMRGDLLARTADLIARGDGRLLLVVDDAHLLDEASAIIVHQLAHSGRAVVVATHRSGTSAPDPIHALWKDGLALRVEVRPLGDDQIDDLLARVLPGPVDGACRRDLRAASRGNPLLLHELVVGAIDAGVLRRADGVWCLTRSLAVTPRLVEVVEARLADLGEDDHDVLHLLAAGEPLDVGLLCRLADPATVDRLEHLRLIEVVGVGPRATARLAHPLYGEVLRDGMTAVGAMAVNRRLADEAEHHPDLGPSELVRAAIWRLDGGGDVDPGIMLEAARVAFFAHDDVMAERLAEQAWLRGREVGAGLLRAQVLGQLGRHEERRTLAAELAERAVSDEERAMVAMEHSVCLWWGLRQGDAAIDVLTAAEREMATGPWRDEVTAQRATFDLLAGRFVDALRRAEPILRHSESPRARLTAAIAMAPALAVMGRGDEALSVADAALAAHLQLGSAEVLSDPGIHVVARVLALTEAGRLDEAHATATVGYDMAIALHTQTGQAWFSLLLGRIDLLTGDLADAAARFREGANVYQALGEDGPRRWCLAGRVMAAAMGGDPGEATLARAVLDAVPSQPTLMMEPDVLRARAWEALARGDTGDARLGLEEAAERAEGSEALSLAMHAWHDLCRIGGADRASERLGRLVSSVAGPLSELRADHARARVGDDVERLAAAVDGFEACGALLLAAEAAAEASAAAGRRQRGRLAQQLSRRASALAARCPGAHTPSLALIGPSRALTDRERQVAELAVDGVPSKVIAARLRLAVRTVENHLQHAYEKLGVSDRTGLREAFQRRG